MTTIVHSGTERGSLAGIPFISNELIRYFIASIAALLVDVGTLYLLTQFAGLHYLISAGTGFLLGLATVYVLSIRWVFSKRRVKKSSHEVIIFSLIGLGGLGINEFGMYLLTDKLLFHFMVSKLVVTGLVFSWNFGIRKLLLFR
ncbi:MAG: GtrA family protein [Gammaproteobacteria bacterium]|nr:GtrA family protein [Gammaproteobacteria bacterium]MCB1850015.1 GtrA family protein [Gammaproteobacteria bacterium]MCP5415744.1 GtrA family protein [Chromatiaceae bacterium]